MTRWIALSGINSAGGRPRLLNMNHIHSIYDSDDGVVIDMGNERIQTELDYISIFDFIRRDSDIYLQENSWLSQYIFESMDKKT